MLTKLRGLLALTGLAAIVIGMPALLIAAAPIGTLSITWTLDGIWQALTTPDNGTIALAVFKLVGWASWVVLTAAILLELAGLIRHAPAPHLPGLALPQLMARRLVCTPGTMNPPRNTFLSDITLYVVAVPRSTVIQGRG